MVAHLHHHITLTPMNLGSSDITLFQFARRYEFDYQWGLNLDNVRKNVCVCEFE